MLIVSCYFFYLVIKLVFLWFFSRVFKFGLKLFIECFIWHIAWVLVVSYGLDLCCWLLNCFNGLFDGLGLLFYFYGFYLVV